MSFCRSTQYLEIVLPLPPPDNHCHASGPRGRYATAAYKDWLDHCAPLLRAELGDWEPDTEHWWYVSGDVALGSRGDCQNYIKPALDLLTGAHVDRVGKVDPATGSVIGKGRISKPGALWDDDARVVIGEWWPSWVRHPDPHVRLTARPLITSPRDYRAEQDAAVKAAREAVRERKQSERLAAKAAAEAERERKRTLRLAVKAAKRISSGKAAV